jgi:hypothetical protein
VLAVEPPLCELAVEEGAVLVVALAERERAGVAHLVAVAEPDALDEWATRGDVVGDAQQPRVELAAREDVVDRRHRHRLGGERGDVIAHEHDLRLG